MAARCRTALSLNSVRLFHLGNVFLRIGIEGGFAFFAAEADLHGSGGGVGFRHILVGDGAFFIDRGLSRTGVFFHGSLLHLGISLELALTLGAAEAYLHFDIAADGGIHVFTGSSSRDFVPNF